MYNIKLSQFSALVDLKNAFDFINMRACWYYFQIKLFLILFLMSYEHTLSLPSLPPSPSKLENPPGTARYSLFPLPGNEIKKK